MEELKTSLKVNITALQKILSDAQNSVAEALEYLDDEKLSANSALGCIIDHEHKLQDAITIYQGIMATSRIMEKA